MALSLSITDRAELLALHMALMEAKFNNRRFSTVIAGSPLVASVARRVLDLLNEEGDGETFSRKVKGRQIEWEIALNEASQTSKWVEWTPKEREEYARVLLAPLEPEPSDVDRFITAVDARWARPGDAPVCDSMWGNTLIFREYDLAVPGEPENGAQVAIGMPLPVPDGSRYYCLFQTTGLSNGNAVRHSYGIDPLQALEAAIEMASAGVASSTEAAEGRLTLKGATGLALRQHREPLRLIGYWCSDEEPGWPDAHDFVDEGWDERERDIIASHLRDGGQVMWAMAGLSPCRFCGEPNGCAELSDGVYLWPEGLAHYLEKHAVRLPQEFVDHVQATLDGREAMTVDRAWWRKQSSATQR